MFKMECLDIWKILLLIMTVRAGGQLDHYTGCPQGWLQYDDQCYKINIYFTTYVDARRLCRNEYANLANLRDRKVKEFLYNELQEGCKDTKSTCGQRASTGQCLSDHNKMREECRFSCGLCFITYRNTEGYHDLCKETARTHSCSTVRTDIRKNCWQSCHFGSYSPKRYWIADFYPLLNGNCSLIHMTSGTLHKRNCTNGSSDAAWKSNFICEQPVRSRPLPWRGGALRGCPVGSIGFGDKCYIAVTIPKSWKDADKDCRSVGGNLPVWDSQRFVYILMLDTVGSHNEMTRVWLSIQISEKNTDICVVLDVTPSSGTVEANCNDKLKFWCEIPRVESDHSLKSDRGTDHGTDHGTDQILKECKGHWVTHRDHCYKGFEEKKNCSFAFSTCSKEGGELLTLHDLDADDYLQIRRQLLRHSTLNLTRLRVLWVSPPSSDSSQSNITKWDVTFQDKPELNLRHVTCEGAEEISEQKNLRQLKLSFICQFHREAITTSTSSDYGWATSKTNSYHATIKTGTYSDYTTPNMRSESNSVTTISRPVSGQITIKTRPGSGQAMTTTTPVSGQTITNTWSDSSQITTKMWSDSDEETVRTRAEYGQASTKTWSNSRQINAETRSDSYHATTSSKSDFETITIKMRPDSGQRTTKVWSDYVQKTTMKKADFGQATTKIQPAASQATTKSDYGLANTNTRSHNHIYYTIMTRRPDSDYVTTATRQDSDQTTSHIYNTIMTRRPDSDYVTTATRRDSDQTTSHIYYTIMTRRPDSDHVTTTTRRDSDQTTSHIYYTIMTWRPDSDHVTTATRRDSDQTTVKLRSVSDHTTTKTNSNSDTVITKKKLHFLQTTVKTSSNLRQDTYFPPNVTSTPPELSTTEKDVLITSADEKTTSYTTQIVMVANVTLATSTDKVPLGRLVFYTILGVFFFIILVVFVVLALWKFGLSYLHNYQRKRQGQHISITDELNYNHLYWIMYSISGYRWFREDQ